MILRKNKTAYNNLGIQVFTLENWVMIQFSATMITIGIVVMQCLKVREKEATGWQSLKMAHNNASALNKNETS